MAAVDVEVVEEEEPEKVMVEDPELEGVETETF
jgi:hypothetical protein